MAHNYKVGLPKEYFPKEMWKEPGYLYPYVKVVTVRANNRTHAAVLGWGRLILLRGKMNPHVKKVSLDVNDPTAGVGGKLGRLIPITVVNPNDPNHWRKLVLQAEGRPAVWKDGTLME